MGKSKGRPKSNRDDATTKIDRRLLGFAQLIARDKGVSVAEFLSEFIREPLEREFDSLMRRRAQR